MELFIIQTGGTIDKGYPRSRGGFAFELGEPAARQIISRSRFSGTVHFMVACRKDSQYIDEKDLIKLEECIRDCGAGYVIVTHGTDTLIDTGKWLSKRITRCVVLTGAFLPETFKDSDADINFGMALGAVQILKDGVYIAMNGLVIPANQAEREPETGLFRYIT